MPWVSNDHPWNGLYGAAISFRIRACRNQRISLDWPIKYCLVHSDTLNSISWIIHSFPSRPQSFFSKPQTYKGGIIMYFVSSPMAWTLALLLASWCGQVSGAPGLLERQGLICVDNQFQQGFSDEPALATPYCSSFLAIPVVTTTQTETVRNR